MNYASIFVYIPSHRTSIVRTTRTAARVDFFALDAASPHTERGAVTRISLIARERKSGALEKDERANDASRVPLPFADVEETAVPTKDAVSWLSPTFSRFARKNVTDVVTTAAVFRVALVEERATTIMGFYNQTTKRKEGGRPQKSKRARKAQGRVFFFRLWFRLSFFPFWSPFLGKNGRPPPRPPLFLSSARKRSIVVVHESAQNTTALSLPLSFSFSSLPLSLSLSLSLSLWR